MKLVMQHPHPQACELACLAMLADVTLDDIIKLVGSPRKPDSPDAERVREALGLRIVDAMVVDGMGARCLGYLIPKHKTMIATLSSCVDVQFAHAVVIHGGQCYDPHWGMNPSWPWDKYISFVRIIEKKGETS